MKVRQAQFALRVVRRQTGHACILYRRTLNEKQEERLQRVTSISPLGFSAGASLLRAAIRASEGPKATLTTGPFHPLDEDWGARVACYALLASGLRDVNRLAKSANNIRHADGTEAAWWFGMMNRHNGTSARAIRAMRILTEAVK